MIAIEPVAELDASFSSGDATAKPWAEARSILETAEVFWISTVRPDGRPHVTPLIAVWSDGALHFTTGPAERKARNLARNTRCILTTGRDSLGEGLDLVVEGAAERVRDEARLRRIAEAYVAKYGEEWRYEVRDGGFWSEGREALVFAVAPDVAFGFNKGEPFGQTRWRFG